MRTSVATRSNTLPTPGSDAAWTSASPPASGSGPIRSDEARGLGMDVDGDLALRRVAGRVGRDRVGQQQRVVEAVDRALGARGEHPDDAAEHRAQQLGRRTVSVASLTVDVSGLIAGSSDGA